MDNDIEIVGHFCRSFDSGCPVPMMRDPGVCQNRMPYLRVVVITDALVAPPVIQLVAQGWKIGLRNSIKMYRAKRKVAHQRGIMVVWTRVLRTALVQVIPADFRLRRGRAILGKRRTAQTIYLTLRIHLVALHRRRLRGRAFPRWYACR